jgi:hypothetical protein
MAGLMPNIKNIMVMGTGISINNPTTYFEFLAQDLKMQKAQASCGVKNHKIKSSTNQTNGESRKHIKLNKM